MMREFVESLKRLYAGARIELITIERQLQNKKITEEEYKYILGTVNVSSSKNN